MLNRNMDAAHESKRIRIAITGGGLAGATLVRALMKHPHIEVHIYESAPEFSELGAAVGLSINAQRALEEMGPEFREALDKAGAVPMRSTRQIVGSGPNASKLIFDLADKEPTLIVHRAALLRELLRAVPRDIMHVNKKLVKIEHVGHGEILLHFKDCSIASTDAIIGADGVHGHVRQHILGSENAAVNAVYAGWWTCRTLVPFDKAKKLLGEEYFQEDRQYGWIGDGGFMMHDILDDGKTVQCIGAVAAESWGSDDWTKAINRKILDDSFATWYDGPVAKGMVELLLDDPEPRAFSQWEHRDASTYVKGRVCVMGDAAHAMTPWQGSGAGQAIEDAMVLDTLLSAVKGPAQLEAALVAYDRVRRPRTQQIVASSSVTGRIMSGMDTEAGLDPDKLRVALGSRWGFILDFDLKKHKEEALAAMK